LSVRSRDWRLDQCGDYTHEYGNHRHKCRVHQFGSEPYALTAIIVDDEQLARDELAYLLKNLDDVNVVAQGKNGLEAIT